MSRPMKILTAIYKYFWKKYTFWVKQMASDGSVHDSTQFQVDLFIGQLSP